MNKIYRFNDGEESHWVAAKNIIEATNYYINNYAEEDQIEFGFSVELLTDEQLSKEVYDEDEEKNISFSVLLDELEEIPGVIASTVY